MYAKKKRKAFKPNASLTSLILQDPETGSLQNLATILQCKCENPKTREACQKTQKFARNCFQNGKT